MYLKQHKSFWNIVKKILTSILLAIIIIFIMCLYQAPNTKTELQTTEKELSSTTTNQTSAISESKTEVETCTLPKSTSENIEQTTKITTTTKPQTAATKTPSKRLGIFKSYTDYRMLSKSSVQWKLQEQAYTDENGLRKIDDAYLVALGSYYGTTLGTRYTVTLSNGSVFDIVLCDCKQDRHTDAKNQVCLSNGSILEFYVDTSQLPKGVRRSGSISSIDFFSGSIISIVQKS